MNPFSLWLEGFTRTCMQLLSSFPSFLWCVRVRVRNGYTYFDTASGTFVVQSFSPL